VKIKDYLRHIQTVEIGACALGLLVLIAGLVLIAHAPHLSLIVFTFVFAFTAGYVAALVPYFLAGLTGLTILGATIAPIFYNEGFPPISVTTSNGKVLAILAFVVLGAAFKVASPGAERRMVLLPAGFALSGVAMSQIGGISLLQIPSVMWVAASGALFVLGLHCSRWTGKLVFSGSAIIALASILFRAPGLHASVGYDDLGARIFGVFGNAVVAAGAVFLLASVLALHFWFTHRTIAIILVLSAVAVSVRTGSRTTFLMAAFFATISIIGYLTWNQRTLLTRRQGYWTVAIFAMVAVAYMYIHSHLGRAGHLATGSESVQARLAGLSAFLSSFRHPLGTKQILVTFNGGINTTTENTWLDIAARLGWLPLLSALVAFGSGIRHGSRSSKVLLGIYVTAGLTSAAYYFPAVYFVTFVGAGWLAGLGDPSRSVQTSASSSVEELRRWSKV
jgi:hypothetical protein